VCVVCALYTYMYVHVYVYIIFTNMYSSSCDFVSSDSSRYAYKYVYI